MSYDGKPRRPAAIGDVLASVLRHAGLTERVAQAAVFPEWAGIVGPQIAAISEPVMLQHDGTLVVAVKSNAWMNELSLLEPQLLKKVNHDPKRPPVKGLRWVLRR